jgi:hypothetical protein
MNEWIKAQLQRFGWFVLSDVYQLSSLFIISSGSRVQCLTLSLICTAQIFRPFLSFKHAKCMPEHLSRPHVTARRSARQRPVHVAGQVLHVRLNVMPVEENVPMLIDRSLDQEHQRRMRSIITDKRTEQKTLIDAHDWLFLVDVYESERVCFSLCFILRINNTGMSHRWSSLSTNMFVSLIFIAVARFYSFCIHGFKSLMSMRIVLGWSFAWIIFSRERRILPYVHDHAYDQLCLDGTKCRCLSFIVMRSYLE